MQQMITILITAALLCVQPGAVAQIRRCQDPSVQRGVDEVKARPKLGVEYAQVAMFKLASRKTTYRIGEMISLDLAILNAGEMPAFFHKLAGPTINLTARDEKGAVLQIVSGTIVLEGIVPQSYVLLRPNEVVMGSLQLLAGFNVEGLSAFGESRERFDQDVHRGRVEYGKGLFDRNLFVNWGDASLRIDRPGTYVITATMVSENVITSRCEPKVRTAVGTIQSTPLTITIIE